MARASDAALYSVLADAGVRYEPMSRSEQWEYQERWRKCYCLPMKARSGKWTRLATDWRVFELPGVRCLLDAKALNAYHNCSERDFLIVPENNEVTALCCQGEALPDLSSVQAELYVFPPDLDWTIVFTHEGPVFSRRSWVSPG